jgi:hypothetical protein
MPTILAYIILRTNNKSNQPVVTHIMSRRSQNLEDRPFLADETKKWHLVANLFYRGIDDMTMIIAEVDCDCRPTVKVINAPRLHLIDTQRDLRSLMVKEMAT